MPNYRYNTPDYMRPLQWPMFHGRSGVLSMKLKKDSGAELFLPN